MKYLDITLPQNVVVSYELARGLERFLASLIDLVAIFILFVIAAFMGSFLGSSNQREEDLILFFAMPVFFYTWAFEYFFNGITLGKLALGLRVVHPEKTRLSVLDTFGRWVMRFIDIWLTSSLLGLILIAGGKKSQRVGDLVTNTYVIKSNASRKISLHGLLKISTKADHEITFDKVRSLLESDMILIKKALDRHNQSRNQAHRDAIRVLAEKAALRVDADQKYLKDPVRFLRLLLKDYIVLTR